LGATEGDIVVVVMMELEGRAGGGVGVGKKASRESEENRNKTLFYAVGKSKVAAQRDAQGPMSHWAHTLLDVSSRKEILTQSLTRIYLGFEAAFPFPLHIPSPAFFLAPFF